MGTDGRTGGRNDFNRFPVKLDREDFQIKMGNISVSRNCMSRTRNKLLKSESTMHGKLQFLSGMIEEA
jgi:hypothetical protein